MNGVKYARTGLVLCTENYQECVDFYTRVLGLPVLFLGVGEAPEDLVEFRPREFATALFA